MNDWHVKNACLRQPRIIFQICNIIHINRIHICLWEGAFSERGTLGNVIRRSEDAIILTMYLYESCYCFHLFCFYYHNIFDILRMHV